MVVMIIIGAIVGFIVYLIGCGFDPNTDNRNAKYAGLGVFLLFVLVAVFRYLGVAF